MHVGFAPIPQKAAGRPDPEVCERELVLSDDVEAEVIGRAAALLQPSQRMPGRQPGVLSHLFDAGSAPE